MGKPTNTFHQSFPVLTKDQTEIRLFKEPVYECERTSILHKGKIIRWESLGLRGGMASIIMGELGCQRR
jgi:hypothetical protein